MAEPIVKSHQLALGLEELMFIVGIEPKAPGIHIFSQTHMPRLGLPQLMTIAKNLGHECLIYCEEIAPLEWEQVKKADMILISSTTSTVPRAYSIIEKIKNQCDSKAPILMGGPHVTFLPEEALCKGVDYVFRHEADESFPSFLEWWCGKRDTSELLRIPGLSVKIGDHFHHGPQPKRVNLDTLPTPDLGLIHGYKNPFTIPIITSRGCPFDCDFCSEVAMFGHAYRFRSEEKILEDIKFYDTHFGHKEIFFADDNLGANRPRLERLCHGIINNGLTRPISGQIRLDLAKYPDTLKLMTKAGFGRAYIGYESTNPETLEKVGKELSADEMGRFTKIIQRMGIEIHAMWVLGFDTDTIDTVKQNLKAAFKWRLETCQFLILVPLPGSSLFNTMKENKRIFNPDWTKYDGHHVTFYPARMTPKQLQVSVMLDAMPKLYNLWQTMRIFIADNYRTAKGSFRLRNWHPIRRTKNSILTLFVRIWGHYTTRKMKRPIKKYIKQMPAMTAEPGHKRS